jgi:hypothetical protein
VNVSVADGVNATFTDCLLSADSGTFVLDAYANANVKLVYCSIVGPGDGTGPSTCVRRRTGGTGNLQVALCRFEGYASDACKPTAGDTVAFCYFDAPTTSATVPTIYTPGTYAVDDLVTESDVSSAHVFRNTIAGNADAPDFNAAIGSTVNGWLYLNPHSDNLTVVQGAGALVLCNVMNMDPARRQSPGAAVVNGGNSGIWGSSSEDNTGLLVIGNYVMSDPTNPGGNPIGGMSGGSFQLNRVESRGHGGVYFFDDASSSVTTIYADNFDPLNANAVIAPATNGTAGSVDLSSLAAPFAADYAREIAHVSLHKAAVTYPHWTDVMGVEIDGMPAQRAEIQPNGRVRVYPIGAAFSSTTVAQFGAGGSSGWIMHDADAYAGLWNNYPLADVGLSDLDGVPLMQLPDASVLASTVAGPAVFQTSDTGPYFADPAQTGAGRTQATMLFEGVIDADQADNLAMLAGATGGTFSMSSISSNGSFRVAYRPDGGSNASSDSATGLFVPGTQIKVVACVDLVAGTARMWLNDGPTPIIDVVTPTGGQFQTNRTVMFLASNGLGAAQVKGAVTRVALWYDVTTDGSLPVSAPYKDIAGDAATVNSDPWKQGADAT